MAKKKVSLSERARINIRAVRKAKELTQQQVADKIGVTQTHVAAIESGRSAIGLNTIEKFAIAFGMDPAELLKG